MALTTLAGRRCLVTGATRGLGIELARALAGMGSRLFLTARNRETLSNVASAWGAESMAVDLADASAVAVLAAEALRTLGGVDIVVNCAGIFPTSTIMESNLEEFDRCFAVNVRAPFQLCNLLAAGMVAQRWGRLVNVGSSSAYAGFKNTSIYCASKHAILGFSRALHDELKEYNVRTFCISPGSIKTDMGRQVRNQDFETFLEPAEIAAFIVHLISHEGPMIAEEVRLNRMVIR